MNYSFYDFLALLGSLGIFLYGMKVMSDALMELAGDSMRSILASATSNRLFAVLTGFVITAIIQSSSATTLMIVSFSNAGLLSLTESIGVIMGANIGTTVTAWLISILGFKVNMATLALPLVGLGFLMSLSKTKSIKNWGLFIVGFSLLFIGLQYLKDAVPDLKSNPDALAFLAEYTSKGFLSVLLFLLIGTALTVVIQSSSATMAITIIMCYEGWIPFEMAVAMILGENIGTTITANLAAWVSNYKAKRTARAHLIFNLTGVIWMLIFFTPFLYAVNAVTIKVEGSSPFTNTAAIPIALALFHTAFNIINTTILINFIPLISRAVKAMVPVDEDVKIIIEEPRFLSKAALKYPQTGIKALLDESMRLLETTTYKVITHGLNVHRSEIEEDKELKDVVNNVQIIEIDIDKIYYEKFKNIYSKIVEFATTLLSSSDLDDDKVKAIRNILRADRLMVEIVKEIKPLHQNINQFSNSNNEHIREEYNRLRRMILNILRVTRKDKTDMNKEDYFESCDQLKDDVDKHDVLINGTIDKLVRNHLITNEMATSLMNDSAIAIEISHNLVDVSSLLFDQKAFYKDTENVEQLEADSAETVNKTTP